MSGADGVVTLATVQSTILQHYRPMLWMGIKAGLGVIASLSLQSRAHCVALNFEGISGAGKSVIIQVLTPSDSSTQDYLVRIDDFTPASFVSTAANKGAQELATIDLLPKIKDKTMLLKELAPTFRDQDDALRKKFAILTSVLDGDGLQRASGSHTVRGYEGRYLFNWLGATTPIPTRTHKVMAQLGNRFLFFEVFGQGSSEKELLEFAKGNEGHNSLKECRRITQLFIALYFQRHRVDTVDPKVIVIDDDQNLEIVRLAKLIACGRIELDWIDSPLDIRNRKQLQIGAPEGPHRVISLLQTIGRGLTLAAGRTVLMAEDLEILRHMALSSIPVSRRQVLRALLSHGGMITASQLDALLNVSRPTAHARMNELHATGLADLVEGNQQTSTPATLKLSPEWTWLMKDAH